MEGTYKLLCKIGLLDKRHIIAFDQYITNQQEFSYKLPLMSYFISQTININPLMSGGNEKVTHTQTNLQLSAAGLLNFV